ncbi:MAG: FAD-binding protein [Methanomassiliicoccales archaeon]|jgi:FAD/FMN-containing dehydrogenase/ferredoxin
MESSAQGCTSVEADAQQFDAKEEPKTGLAFDIEAKGIPGLRVVSGKGELMLFSRDQSDIPQLLKDMLLNYRPDAVVQPSTAEAIVAILGYAERRGLKVIPRGISSSPFGGAVPVDGGIVIDLSSMNGIINVDPSQKRVTVLAGARWGDIDHELGKSGLRLITSPSSKFSTVGGWIAGGGIGIGSLGGGHLSENVLTVKVANPKGVRTYVKGEEDFRHLFGSEGQLGVIVEATMMVKAKDPSSRPHLIVLPELKDAIDLAISLKRLDPIPEDLIYFSPNKMAYSNDLLHLDILPEGHALLVTSSNEASEKAIVSLLTSKGVTEAGEHLARLLSHDRYFPMKLRRMGPGMLGAEVLTPTAKLEDMLAKAEELCEAFALDPLLEAHFLQGKDSLMLCYYPTDQGNQMLYALDAVKSMIVTASLVDMGARPYSLGIWNNSFVDSLPEEEMKGMSESKKRMDPGQMFNNGKFFELKGRTFGIPSMLLTPMVAGNGLKIMSSMSSTLSPFLKAATAVAKRTMGPKSRDPLKELADQCAMCGACVAVCPAYNLIGDERVTARGKLVTARTLIDGGKISEEHAQRTFLCMRCKACEQVCQSKLGLMAAYDDLESRIEKRYKKDAKEIEAFVKFAESSDIYEELIDKGLVLGSPKNGMGGE